MEDLKVLISKEEINKRLDEMAEILDRDYEGKAITVLSVLNGAVFFTTDLTSRMKTKMQFAFIKVSSYEGTESTGEIKMKLDLKDSIQGKDVIVVEDIIDTGRTLSYLLEYLKMKKPNSVKLCTLLDKPDRRVMKDVKVDYTGFEIPDKFVVGYGLDWDEKYRNLPYIGYIEQ
jgi:hypoxanthine phosphoribosyltransferase